MPAEGINWLVNLHEQGNLADEMGLGKTVQPISVMACLSEVRAKHLGTIIVLPKKYCVLSRRFIVLG